MGTKIAVTVIVIIYLLFFLSVFAPMHSQKKFWVVIHRIRDGMDFICYWFFNLCGIATILYIVCMVVNGLLAR